MGQTKALLLRWAEHNRTSNSEMLQILVDRLDDPWNLGLRGDPFRTLGEILDHSYVVDTNWMHHLQTCSREVISLPWRFSRLDHHARALAGFEEYRTQRPLLDQAIVEFFLRVEEEHLVPTADEAGDGRSVPWLPAIHLWNHQTHHRGQVSQILDSLGIPNDYSSLLRW